jgi:hypothetical protein
MFRLLSVIAFLTICSTADIVAQVYVPPPVRVPAPVNSSSILVQREIGRTAAKRRKSVRPRKSSKTAKSPATKGKVSSTGSATPSKPPASTPGAATPAHPTSAPSSSAPSTASPSSANGQTSSTGPAGLAQQMPNIYGPYLANISRVRIWGKDERSSAYSSSSKRSAGGVSVAQGTAFNSSEPPFVPQQLADRLGKTAQERQYIEGVLTKCLNFYVDTAIQKGVPLNDVALALNYFISTNYFVYSSGGGPTPSQMSATRDLIRANMGQDNVFRGMSDKQKQEAYETLIVLAGFVDLGYGTAKQSGDANAAAQFREMAKNNLETLLGTPIEKIHFTNNGLALN